MLRLGFIAVLLVAAFEGVAVRADTDRSVDPKIQFVVAQVEAAFQRIDSATYSADYKGFAIRQGERVDLAKRFQITDAARGQLRHVETHLPDGDGQFALHRRDVLNPNYTAGAPSRGTQAQQYFFEEGKLGDRSYAKRVGADPARITQYAFGTGDLRPLDTNAIQPMEGVEWVLAGAPNVDGLTVLERRIADAPLSYAVTRFYIDSAHGYMVRRIERTTPDGQLAFKREITAVEKVDDVFLPTRVTETTYAIDAVPTGGLKPGDPLRHAELTFQVGSVNDPPDNELFGLDALQLVEKAIVTQEYPDGAIRHAFYVPGVGSIDWKVAGTGVGGLDSIDSLEAIDDATLSGSGEQPTAPLADDQGATLERAAGQSPGSAGPAEPNPGDRPDALRMVLIGASVAIALIALGLYAWCLCRPSQPTT